MGLENGLVKPDQITASSHLDDQHKPEDGVLNNPTGSWRPVTNDQTQYLQVDLGHLVHVTGFITQGEPETTDFVTTYYVTFSTDGVNFVPYTDDGKVVTFPANSDSTTPVTNLLDLSRPITAQYIQIHPVTWNDNIALQAEILGCGVTPTTTVASTETTPGTTVVTTMSTPVATTLGTTIQTTETPSTILVTETPGTTTTGSIIETTGTTTLGVVETTKPTTIGTVTQTEPGTTTQAVTGQTTTTGAVTQTQPGTTTQTGTTKPTPTVTIQVTDTTGTLVTVTGVVTEPTGQTTTQAVTQTQTVTSSQPVTYTDVITQTQTTKPEVTTTLATTKPTATQTILVTDTVGTTTTGSTATTKPQTTLVTGTTAGTTTTGFVTGTTTTKPTPVTTLITGTTGTTTTGVVIDTTTIKPTEIQTTLVTGTTLGTTTTGIVTETTTTGATKPTTPVTTTAVHNEVCTEPLGMEGGQIKPDQITASSQLDDQHKPEDGVLNNPSAWKPDDTDVNPYIQIDLLEPTHVTGFITQGKPETNEFVTTYTVYFSNDGVNFLPYTDEFNRPVTFTANSDSTTPVTNLLDVNRPITAQYFQIHPTTWNEDIAMQVEALGCKEPTTTTATVGTTTQTTTPIIVVSTTGTTMITTTTTPAGPLPCQEPLGMESGEIKPEQITASSVYPDPIVSHGPEQAILNNLPNVDGTGAWSPSPDDVNPYLQVDLGELVQVTGFITQGRPEHTPEQYVTEYTVYYSTDGINFIPYTDDTNTPVVFNANTDTTTPVTNLVSISRPILAQYVQIHPQSYNEYPSMQLEILGCRVNEPTTTQLYTTTTGTQPISTVVVTETTTKPVTQTSEQTTIGQTTTTGSYSDQHCD